MGGITGSHPASRIPHPASRIPSSHPSSHPLSASSLRILSSHPASRILSSKNKRGAPRRKRRTTLAQPSAAYCRTVVVVWLVEVGVGGNSVVVVVCRVVVLEVTGDGDEQATVVASATAQRAKRSMERFFIG